MFAETLVLGADENGGEDVAGDEEEEETVVEVGVVEGIEDGEEDEAGGAGYGEENCGGWGISVSFVCGCSCLMRELFFRISLGLHGFFLSR